MPSVASYSGGSASAADQPSKCHSCLKVTKSVTSFLLSHIGLLSLVVGYCIMGAFIFQELERANEIETKRQMKEKRLAMTETLWDITRGMDVLHQENWTSEVTSSLKKFEKQLIIALKEKGWDGKEDESTVTWTFAGALFYCITVITTIGYGHIAPKTPVGKIVTIFYAIVGIPITVICWSNIGDAMAHAFRFCYWRICCYVYVRKTKKRRKRMISRQRQMSMRHPPSTISRARSMRRTTRQRSADSKLTTQTNQTIQTQSDSGVVSVGEAADKFDDNHAVDKDKEKTRTGSKKSASLVIDVKPSSEQVNSVHGVQYLDTPKTPDDPNSGTVSASGNANEKEVKSERVSIKERWARMGGKAIMRGEIESQKSGGSQGSAGGGNIQNNVARGQQRTDDGWYDDQSFYEVEYYYEDSDEDTDVDYSRKPVPILLSIILVVAYIIGGAFLFQMWEGWSFLDSSYFCFITLTTIGFGDLTPDQRNDDGDGEQRIALCSLYLLFGIAMIAMSFNLLQEEVINSVKSLGKMCGIIKDNEDEEDY